jgi:hypothetical protein
MLETYEETIALVQRQKESSEKSAQDSGEMIALKKKK